MLKHIDDNHDGLKDLLIVSEWSVHTQETHSLRTSRDRRGEQTINKDSKTSGLYLFYSDSLMIVANLYF